MNTELKNPIQLSDNAIKVLESRYLRKDERGNVSETPDQMFQRVAKAISRAELAWGKPEQAEKWEKNFFEIMHSLYFLPNSPTLMNAGIEYGQLSACFVLPVEDHLMDIFATLKLSALIQQSGGGTGFNFSHLRPKNDFLNHTQGTASGPVSFMKIFDAATEHVKQGGKRRGANMGILNIDHPDIEEFISCKREEGNLRNFNISIGMTDAFMQILDRDGYWQLVHPNSHKVVKTIKANALWKSVIDNTWLSGDPGLIFLDTINASNPTPSLGKIEATNPCGEVPLLPYESCNLGALNLSKFINRDKHRSSIAWSAFQQTIAAATRFLDNVIEINHYHSPQIKKIVQGNRKIGLGVMGWAEALAKLEIPYESDNALKLAGEIMKFIAKKSRDASIALAHERGTFKNWERSIYYPHTPIRNATRTSIAPTGTISIIADTSPSIEPFFALAYQRKHVLQDETLQEMNKVLLRYLVNHNIEKGNIITAITQTGTLENVNEVTDPVKDIFKTALEIHPSWHLKHQAAFQKYTDNAVSKTVNLPQHSTPSDISSIYKRAWKEKLKGITIFRNNSRKTQVIEQGIISDIKGCKVCFE